MSLANRPRLTLSATDAAKLEWIWNDHAAGVLGMLKTFCASPEDAQDVLQELFLRVGKNPSVVESAKSPRAFLIVSARRIAIDAARKRASDQRREESPEAAEAVHPSPMAPKNDGDLALAISKAIAELPPEQRFVFEAKVLHGKTLSVIAAEQSITLNTAASRLRYSLDKIRSRLRPQYEAMKNQTTKPNTLSDSSARLIKPLEPKRVPSVVPGLEGVAAFAVADSHIESIDVHEPILFVCPAPVELPAPEPVNPAWHVDPVVSEPETYELPSEPVGYVPDVHVDPMVTQEVEPTDAEVHVDPTDDASSSASGEDSSQTPDDTSDGSTELLTAIFESNFSNQAGIVEHGPESGIDFTDDIDQHNPDEPFEHPNLGEFFTLEIQPGHTDGESVDHTDPLNISDFGEQDSNEYLLSEYKNFLGDHPDWIEAHAGGDIQAQVITPSEYTGIEWENPGVAHSFDQWFHATYIAPYEGSTPVEGGTLLVAPDYQDHGTLLVSGETENPVLTGAGSLELAGSGLMNGGEFHGDGLLACDGYLLSGNGHQIVMDQPTGVPEAWMRGGTLEFSGGQLIVNNTFAMSGQIGGGIPTLALSGGSPLPVNGAGVVHTENLNTGHDLSVPALGETSQTIVTGGRVVAADPVAGSFIVENGGSVSIGDQVFGEGTYNFNAESAMDSESLAVADVVAPAGTHTAAAKPEAHTAEAHGTASIQFSVTPIVSGSDSPIEAQEGHDLSHGQAATPLVNLHTPTYASVDLPVLINSQEIQHLDNSADDAAGITFVDDDTYVAPANSHLDAVSAGVPASATHDVAAAVGGAFVAGSATQVAPAAKGLLPRKSLIA